MRSKLKLLVVLVALSPAARSRCEAPAAGASAIEVNVDARESARGVFHSHLVVPVAEGPLTLTYPAWIPGEHGPTGPIQQVTGLRFSSGGKTLEWRRDAVDMFAFHVVVPPGGKTLEADFDYLSPPESFASGYGNGPNATRDLFVLLWNQQVLVPHGTRSDALSCRATLRLPRGFSFDTALAVARKDPGGDTVEFAPVSLTTLVDSPVLSGAHFRTIAIADGDAPVRLSIAADDAADLDVPERRIEALRKVVAEAQVLFGARHYRSYVWLLSLSDAFDPNGLEHPECSDNRLPAKTFLDEKPRLAEMRTLAHEYVHSWNGKYRRPRGLATGDYEKPMEGELLFVYEGLTRYLGDLVLTPRAGIMDAAERREYLAWIASSLEDANPGRRWRSLADTAVSAQLLYGAPSAWTGARRSVDFYDESGLIWLEADVLIRQKTKGARSLDDFCRRFFGAPGGPPSVSTYVLDDVFAALDQVLPYDWRGFFDARVYKVDTHAPLSGLERAGWKLAYGKQPNLFRAARAASRKEVDWTSGLGLRVSPEGKVVDVLPDSPAFAAGVVAGSKIFAVSGVKWSADALRAALVASTTSKAPMEVVVERDERLTTAHIDFHGGAREPHLERLGGSPDLLAEIGAPRAANGPAR